jgi:hypothetical protein
MNTRKLDRKNPKGNAKEDQREHSCCRDHPCDHRKDEAPKKRKLDRKITVYIKRK